MERQGYIHQKVEDWRKYIKAKIHKHKKRARWNWPELHLYCGMCDLRTGLYIRSVVSVLIYCINLTINSIMLYYILCTGSMLSAMEMSDIEDYFEINLTEVYLERVKQIYRILVAYLILWIIFKIVYIIVTLVTIYAIYKKKTKMMKVILFVNTLNLILDIILSTFGIVLTQIVGKALFIVVVLFEGYNLMAISSEYKKLRGKSKLLMNMGDTNPNVEVVAITPSVLPQYENIVSRPLEDRQHCISCTCHLTPFMPRNVEAGSTEVEVTSNSNQPSVTAVDEEKSMNIKDIEIIFNQDQLLPQYSPVFETVQCVNETVVTSVNLERLPRPTSLQLTPNDLEEKIDIADEPIIYDDNQLQVGGNLVVESRENLQT